MHFSDIKDGSGSKFTKIAVVAALHVAIGAALIANMNGKVFNKPPPEEAAIVMIDPVTPPPKPPELEPPKPVEKVMPEVFKPKVEVEVAALPVVPTVTATEISEPVPVQPPGPVAVVEAPPATPAANTGAMRTAVLADANACVKPDYPTNAARLGETGVVTLALLVGTDGKVASSKIQKSSGHRDLDKAAVAALSMCKFKPAMAGGVPEQAWAQLSYVWTLDS